MNNFDSIVLTVIIANVIAAISIKAKETIEDKYDRLTKEAYDA